MGLAVGAALERASAKVKKKKEQPRHENTKERELN
jgi:hypothetical protein